ncbi:hypothetical protein CRENBAI_009802 [Crenichthys baileyi]|uniref:Uncharacterized protein n=1 Tax=Crenichthys baileyi TaxID=28760 RepID=A0AAV9QXF7_9TELE
MLLLCFLLLSPTLQGWVQRMLGQKKSDLCVCKVNAIMWSFPTVRYEAVQQQVETFAQSAGAGVGFQSAFSSDPESSCKLDGHISTCMIAGCTQRCPFDSWARSSVS